MSQALYLLPLLLLISSILKTSTAPVVKPALPVDSPFVAVTVESAVVRVGETQNIQVTLQGASRQLTILTLAVTYPSGASEQVIDSTLGNTASLSWTVPPVSGVGIATFQLSKGGCGCGDRSMRVQNVLSTGMVEGSFKVIR